MKLVYFAWVRQQVGIPEETVEKPAGVRTVADLARWLAARGPRYEAVFSDLKRLKAARNQTYVGFDAAIEDGDEIAFFPPVTGG